MEAAISAIAGELINRCISFLTRKYKDMTGADDKLERLRQLLLRIHAVVEEADGRYITNSKMLMQLKLIAESMYQGYNMLDTAKYRFLPLSVEEEEGSCSASTSSTTSSPMKRLRTISGATREFATDVDDEDWVKFYSSVTRMSGSGSKVIVISRLQSVARVGTTTPVYLNILSQEEFSYLFKMLVFGSTDARDSPQLASIANKLAKILGGSLALANAMADLLRRNHDIQFFLRMLRWFKGGLDHNIAKFGEHPRNLLEKGHPIYITGFTSSSRPVPFLLMPPRVRRDDDPPRRKLPQVKFGELIAGLTAIPMRSLR